MLQPLIDRKNPAALFLYAHLSISGTETEEEYDARRLGILRSLNDLGYAPGIYEFGICYEIGDLVERDHLFASALYKRAAELGYPKAKLSYGLDLYYGSNGIKKDEALGLEFIKQAAAENVEGADAQWNELSRG